MKQLFGKRETVMQYVFFLAALGSVLALLLICVFLFSNGLPALKEIGLFDFLLGEKWTPTDMPPTFGVLPMILGSLYITFGAALIGVPIGVLTAVYLVFYCPPKLYKLLKPASDLLAGIPSVVYGFFGLIILVPFVRMVFGGTGTSILTASFLLGIMILPTIIGVSEAAIRAVPSYYYEGSIALGASHEKSIFGVVLPGAIQGILTAVVLGIGRAIGETMAVIMVAGNQARMPAGLLQGVRTLTANIVIEMGYAAGLHREALLATAVILFVFVLILNMVFVQHKKGK